MASAWRTGFGSQKATDVMVTCVLVPCLMPLENTVHAGRVHAAKRFMFVMAGLRTMANSMVIYVMCLFFGVRVLYLLCHPIYRGWRDLVPGGYVWEVGGPGPLPQGACQVMYDAVGRTPGPIRCVGIYVVFGPVGHGGDVAVPVFVFEPADKWEYDIKVPPVGAQRTLCRSRGEAVMLANKPRWSRESPVVKKTGLGKEGGDVE